MNVVVDKEGKYEVQVEQRVADQSGTPDSAFRMALAITEAAARIKDASQARAPFDIELEAWRGALQSIEEADTAAGKGLADPALRQMRVFEKDGQLQGAILPLLYRESCRPALEAWLAREPQGVKQFVDRYGIRP